MNIYLFIFLSLDDGSLIRRKSKTDQNTRSRPTKTLPYLMFSGHLIIIVAVYQGQGHCRHSKVFPIYHNTNCQVL